MRITKVKFDGKKVRIEYEQPRGASEDPDEFALACADQPRRQFNEALQALTRDLIDICELSRGSASEITIRGVSFTWTEDIMGVVITGLKTLKTANSPLVLNSPHLPESPYGEGDPASTYLLDKATCGRLWVLLHEAELYVGGERAQRPLPLEPAGAATVEVARA